MKDRIVAVGLGVALCAVVITGNVVRADPHLVSIYPDVVSGMVAPLAVYLAGRRRRLRGESSAAVQAFAARIGASAGAVFAVGLTVFTATGSLRRRSGRSAASRHSAPCSY